MNGHNEQNHLDEATSRRLAKLGALPVDTTNLDRRLRALIPPAEQTAPMSLRLRTPMRIAAGLLIVSGIVAASIFAVRETPAVASPAQLVQMHDDAVAGRGHVVRVGSLAEAQRVLSQQWSARPDLPQIPGADVMACCLHEMGKARMAAVTLSADGVPITLAVADASDLRSPKSLRTLWRDGVEWHVESSGEINMVSARQEGRWVCLMGRAPVEKLMDLAQSVKF